ncbi:hypothetical protein VZ95_03060 [Elstera litoralis]|uniref:histidine kinase n=1 Tax=Elstera litoralis TaxID=552518 RepID=A0A0F3IVQ3_9PROT|nr:histidine kinase dimerization/phosphoacceptor domain -containing protein [Elstera litoralis]KJV10712.1 hypothetical protein VZ95_03060 [Elstera litoralis]
MPFSSKTLLPLKTLYLDDDAGLGVLVKKAMSRRGHNVVPVTNSQEAFDLLAQGGFDVMALDHSLVGETGLDVLARLGPRTERLPVVYVTGSADARLALQALRAGADEYVIKDTAAEFYDLLIAAIENVTERWRLKRQRADDEKAVREARDRAELLLQEVNHRVANSLGLVAAMVRMQSAALSDPGAIAALQETQARITAIAGVHRRLYTSDRIGLVEIDDYLEHLVGELQTSLADDEHPYSIRLNAERLTIPIDKAVSVGVIVGELVTNAFKYAYDPGAPGEIRVSMRQDPVAIVHLTVEDDGQGFDPRLPSRGTGLGSKILGAIAASLKAVVDYPSTASGTRVRVTFSLD